MEQKYIKIYLSLDRYEKAGFGNPHITPLHDLVAIHINAWRWFRLGGHLKPPIVICVWPIILVFIGAWIWQIVFDYDQVWMEVHPAAFILILYSICVSATLGAAITYRINHLRLLSRYGVEKAVDGRLIFNTERGEVDAYKATVLSKCIGWAIGLLISATIVISMVALEDFMSS